MDLEKNFDLKLMSFQEVFSLENIIFFNLAIQAPIPLPIGCH